MHRFEQERIAGEYRRRAAAGLGDRYAPTAPGTLLILHEVERAAAAALRSRGMLPLTGRRLLDVGCGPGGYLALFDGWGVRRADLAGIDLVAERVEAARARVPGADVRVGGAAELPWPDASFDIVFQSMMMSSILDAGLRRAVADEMARVLRPGGVVLWYDFFVSHPRNPATRGVGRRELRSLFGGFEAAVRRVTLAPPLARRLAPRARLVAEALAALRVLDTHLLAVMWRS
jgi:SAM-dependent methyltransferase